MERVLFGVPVKSLSCCQRWLCLYFFIVSLSHRRRTQFLLIESPAHISKAIQRNDCQKKKNGEKRLKMPKRAFTRLRKTDTITIQLDWSAFVPLNRCYLEV